MFTRIESNDVRSLLPKRAIVWRPIANGELAPINWSVGPQRDAVCRILAAGYGQGINEPVVNNYAGPKTVFGIVGIVPYDVPPDWAYAIVRGHNKSGRCVFLEPQKLASDEELADYIAWREDVKTYFNFDVPMATNEEEGHRLSDLAASAHPFKLAPNTFRVQRVYNFTERAYYGLVHG